MAEILENGFARKTIKLSVDDVIDVVREYQNITSDCRDLTEIRNKISLFSFYLPEDV